MSWITIIWSLIWSACFTLAALHLLIWWRNRREWANLFFALMAMMMSAITFCEFKLMQAETIGEYGLVLRWTHVPFWVLLLSMVAFVRIHFRAGRPWLAWAACGLRTVSLILNFVFTPNLNYREITGLSHIRFLGESVSVAEGVPNSWMLVGQASLLLFLAFIMDVMITVWRRSGWGRERFLVCTILFFLTMEVGLIISVLWGIIAIPFMPGLLFVGVIAAMGFELSDGVIQAAKLSKDWQITFDSVPYPLMILGSDCKIVQANVATQSFFDLPRESILGSDYHTLMHRTEETVEGYSWLKTIQPGRREEKEFYDESRQAWFHVSADPIFNEKKEVKQIIFRIQNITEKKRIEAEAFAFRKELLRTDRVMRMGELTASLAHELNQPLAAILSNAGAALRFIESDKLDLGELTEILQDIVNDDKRAGKIIRSLRSMVKPEEAVLELIDINPLVLEVVALFNSEAIIRRIKVETDLAYPLPDVTADKVQIQQVIVNLMMNAADAMLANSEIRKMVIRTQPAGKAEVLVAIRDFGPGVDEKELPRIFEPFFTTKRSGLGMGLSLSLSIIEASGGHLWAENNPDGGATFFFKLRGGG
jgi:two-component system, LuxR family, sensor kinase FixL